MSPENPPHRLRHLCSHSGGSQGVLFPPQGLWSHRPLRPSLWISSPYSSVHRRKTFTRHCLGPKKKGLSPQEDIPSSKELFISRMRQSVIMEYTCVQFVLTRGPYRLLLHSMSKVINLSFLSKNLLYNCYLQSSFSHCISHKIPFLVHFYVF